MNYTHTHQALGAYVSGADLIRCKDAIVERAIYKLRDNCEQRGIDFCNTNVNLVVGSIGIETCIADAANRFTNPGGLEVDVYSFPQVWASTALGFGGIGGQAISKAQTTVIISKWTFEACVYFGGQFAYMIKKPNQLFYETLHDHKMPERRLASKLERL